MPQIQVFQCPACGANLSYDGGPETTFACQFCGTSVIVPEELRSHEATQPESQGTPPVSVSSAPAADQAAPLAEVVRLARAGQQVEAVQLMRQINPSLGLREALDAVNAMGGAGASNRAGASRSRGAGCTCISTVLVVAAIVSFVGGIMYLPFRLSGSYQQALNAARSDPSVIQALGAPIEVDWWPGTGEISCGGGSCSADYIIPLHGSRKSGRIDVMSDSTGAGFFNEGTWTLDAAVVVNNGPTIELTPPPPPVPTLSAQHIGATQEAGARSTQEAEAALEAEATAVQGEQDAETATAAAQPTVLAAQTATAAADARAIAQATAQVVIAAQSGWPVLMSDTFADNHLGWPTGFEKGTIAITTTVAGKKYIWDVAPIDLAHGNAFPLKTRPLTDFAASVNVKFVRGGGDGESDYGLVFRHADQDYGFFGIGSDGQFWVRLDYASGVLEGYGDNSDAIHAQLGQINKLTVRSLGSDLIFLINDQTVSQLSQELPAGDVGLGVDFQSSDAQPALVEFSNFEVRAPK